MPFAVVIGLGAVALLSGPIFGGVRWHAWNREHSRIHSSIAMPKTSPRSRSSERRRKLRSKPALPWRGRARSSTPEESKSRRAQQRHRQAEHGERVRRGEDRGQREQADDGIAARMAQRLL